VRTVGISTQVPGAGGRISPWCRVARSTLLSRRGGPQLTSFHQPFCRFIPCHAGRHQFDTLAPVLERPLLLLDFDMHLLHHTLDLASRSAWAGTGGPTRVLSLCRVFSSGLSTRYHRLSFLSLRAATSHARCARRWSAGHVVSGLTSRHARKGKGRCSSIVQSLDRRSKV
jgi:hypothetical protein